MQANFQKALARVLVYEGGKVNDPHDPGGKTNQGVTQATYSAWRRAKGLGALDVFQMPNEDRDAIYKGEYWDRVQGDSLPDGLDFAVFDAAVNSGVGQASKWLQSALGSAYTGQIDGVLGSKSLQAVNSGDDETLIIGVCSRRLAMLKRLATWKYYGPGWSARIANVQKTALAWADAGPEPANISLEQIGSAKAPVTDLKPPVISEMTTHVTTVASGAGTAASQAATQIQGITDTFTWIKYIFAGLTFASAIAGIIAFVSSKTNDAVTAGTATATVDLEADTKLVATAQAKKA